MTETATKEEVGMETSWNRSTGENLEAGHRHSSLYQWSSICALPNVQLEDFKKKKKSKILGSYKPKQLKASQPSTRQNEPSTSQEEREPTLPGSSNGIESTGAWTMAQTSVSLPLSPTGKGKGKFTCTTAGEEADETLKQF